MSTTCGGPLGWLRVGTVAGSDLPVRDTPERQRQKDDRTLDRPGQTGARCHSLRSYFRYAGFIGQYSR